MRRYLDHAASTPIDPRVTQAVVRALELTGNPSSLHTEGRKCREVVETAREHVAALLHVPASTVTFTSGASEANALAIRGAYKAIARNAPGAAHRVVCAPNEHASVVDAVRVLERDHGAVVTWLEADAEGGCDANMVESAIGADVVMIVMMQANNVTGLLRPVAEVGRAVAAERVRRGRGGLPIVFVSDAVQAVRTEDVDPFRDGVDLCILSSHKIYGPKGVGALVRRSGAPCEALVAAGGQEDGMRGGTENVAAIAGFGEAACILAGERSADRAHALRLRSVLQDAVAKKYPDGRVRIVGDASKSLPGIVSLSGRGLGDETVLRLDAEGFAVSSGSACESGKRRPSAGADGRTLRVSFGRGSSERDMRDLIDALVRIRA